MKLKSNEIAEIKRRFSEMISLEDFVLLLNFVNELLYKEKAKLIVQQDVLHFANVIPENKKYLVFQIPKKSGGKRMIHAPVGKLKVLQTLTSLILQCSFDAHRRSHGFVWNRNVKTNASFHVGSNYVYNIDLEDFFGTVHRTRVEAVLGTHPFHLGGKGKLNSECHPWREFVQKYNFVFSRYCDVKKVTEEEFERIFRNLEFIEGAHFTTISLARGEKSHHLYVILGDSSYVIEDRTIKAFYVLDHSDILIRRGVIGTIVSKISTGLKMKKDGENDKVSFVLPQGSPCSPVLTNIVCRQLDNSLEYIAKKHNLKYSRYADDITFSSMHNAYNKDGDFVKELQQLIQSHGFTINLSKVRLQKKQWRQEVTGLLVNEKVNLHKRRWKEIRKWLYYIERYGIKKATDLFERKHVSLTLYLRGHISYASMIYGSDTDRIKLLKQRLTNCGIVDEKLTSEEDLAVMSILQSGIENGLEQYGKKTKRGRKE